METEILTNFTSFGQKRQSVNLSGDNTHENTHDDPNNLNPSQYYDPILFTQPQTPSAPPQFEPAPPRDTGCQDGVPGRPPSINPESLQCPRCSLAGGGPRSPPRSSPRSST
eukprot:244248-Rhodomonas_salina.1